MKTPSYFSKLTLATTSLLLFALFSGSGCSDNEPNPVNLPYEEGYIIGNEGAFGNSNASIGFHFFGGAGYNSDLVAVENQGLITGDVLQSMFTGDSLLWLVLNNSNRILILNRFTMKYRGEISSLQLPRYLVEGQKGLYLSEWLSFSGNGQVRKINPNTQQLEGSVAVGILPENLLAHQGKLYVPNSSDSTISVITEQPFAKETDIVVGDYPQACLALNGSIWVMNGGKPDWTGSFSHGSWVKLNSQGGISTEITLNQVLANPTRAVASPDGRYGYFILDGDVWFLDAQEETVGVLISGANAYGLGVDTRNGDLIVGEAGDFSNASDVAIYSNQGEFQLRFTAGIAPSSFAVNP